MRLSAPQKLGKTPVYPTEMVSPGTVIAAADGWLAAHPLDIIAFHHARDPLTRLDHAMAWILARALRRLDAAEARLTP